MKRYALGVDLGGTNIAVGLVNEDHHIVDHLSRAQGYISLCTDSTC